MLEFLTLLVPAPPPPIELVVAPSLEEDAATLVARLLLERDRASTADIEALGKHADATAWSGLRKLIPLLSRESRLEAGFEALRHFGGTELAPDVVAFVAEQVFTRDEARREAAAWCLLEFRAIAQSELRRVVDRSKDAACRAIALQGLLRALERERTPEALELVLEHARIGVTARRPRLHDLFLNFEGPEHDRVFERALRRKSLSPFLKTIVIDALSKRQGIDESAAKVLQAALRAKHPSVEYTALRWLLAPAGPHPIDYRSEVGLLTRSRDPSVRRAALIALGRIRRVEEEPEARLKALRKHARSKQPAERQAAAVLLAQEGSDEAAAVLHALLTDANRTVATEALFAVGHMRRKHSIPLLIDLLEGATGQPRHDVPAVLRSLTGLDHGLTASRWLGWWRDEGEAFELPLVGEVREAEEKRARRRDAGASQAAFYGLPVVSERVAFVLDVSGSMDTEVADGETRLEVAQRELRGVLERLAADTLVNVVFFSTQVQAWREELVPLNPASRAELDAFIADQKPRGLTNLHDALATALSDRGVDTLYLLTDGKPQGGATASPKQILHEVERWNSTAHIVIHGIAVGQENELIRDLAAATGGEYQLAD